MAIHWECTRPPGRQHVTAVSLWKGKWSVAKRMIGSQPHHSQNEPPVGYEGREDAET